MNRKSKERYCKILAKRLENIDFLKFYDYNCVIGSWVINACETTPWETAGLTNAEALANLLNKRRIKIEV